MLLMVSVDESKVGFVLINPFVLCPDYAPQMTPQELSCLGAKEIGELACYSICVVNSDYLNNTVNLKCPIMVNSETRQGIQVILENPSYGYRHEFRSFLTETDSADHQD